jgi:hypothetical protein
MEQDLRIQAIQRYQKGESPKTIYTDLHRSKNWFFKWLKRFQSGDPNWYQDISRAPKRRPTAISEIERQLIVSVREHLESQKSAQTGTSAIKWELSKSGFAFPSDRTIHRILKREGLIKKNCLHAQRCWVPIFYRCAWFQQYSTSRPGWPQIHKGGWQILLVQSDGCL